MSESDAGVKETVFSPYFLITLILTLVVPVFILHSVNNVFNTPKTLLMLVGVSLMIGIYCFQFLRGQRVLKPGTTTEKIILFLILLNFFSFFYTQNPYFTAKAAVLNITCLVLFYFVSINTDGKRAIVLISAAAFSGLLVSTIVWLQFFDIYILIKWARTEEMIMGTIGNSNFLGAYLVFPLFAVAGLIFLLKGKFRLIPVGLSIFLTGAFLFSRARASWLGFFLTLPFFLYIIMKIHGISISAYVHAHSRRVVAYGLVLLAILISLWYMAPQRFHDMMDYRNVFESETLRLRMAKYFPPSIRLFKQSPLFGTGLWSYRSMVYEAQAEINRIDPGYFENYPEPKPRRVHNEYLEILNDGGLVAATALLLFLLVVMRHGWKVIKDEEADPRDRIIAAMAFCSICAIMLASLFFFPFRVNSTMFMTVLMMGLMEGIYLSRYGLKSSTGEWISPTKFVLIPMVFLVIIGVIWHTGIRPFKGEMEHLKYKVSESRTDAKGAERHILKAIEYDPRNSAYHLYASRFYVNALKDYRKASDFIERAIVDFNGDITMWLVYFYKGLIKFQVGSPLEARAAFEKALYYNPTFEPARKKLEEVNQLIKTHDSVTIKFR
ncbi:MAG: O-antigen ligase family protein [Deltaproteobacteria bacterium]|nr:O-antigen ligase family protein [Deltaproteobacteria bacterium]